MAKNKKTNKKNNSTKPRISDEKMIKERIRKLPIYKCYLNSNWQKTGMAVAVVVREHKGGTVSIGLFLTDTYCIGVKDAMWRINVEKEAIQDILDLYARHGNDLEEVDYAMVHNLVLGAVEFAEEAGISPCKEFDTAEYFLEPDTDDIPLMEFEFGKNGKHCLIATSPLMQSQYMPLLEKNLGPGNYDYIVEYDTYDDDDDYFEDEVGYYTYEAPEYNGHKKIKLRRLLEIVDNPEITHILSDEEIEEVKAMPIDDVVSDLDALIYRELSFHQKGREDIGDNRLVRIALLANEIGDSRLLKPMLEVLRQSEDFYDEELCDISETVLLPTLLKVSNGDMTQLRDIVTDKRLFYMYRAIAQSAITESLRYEETKEAAEKAIREIADYYLSEPEGDHGLYELSAFLVSDLLNVCYKPLYEVIEQLYEADVVDTGGSGTIENVREKIAENRKPTQSFEMDARKIIAEIERFYTEDY